MPNIFRAPRVATPRNPSAAYRAQRRHPTAHLSQHNLLAASPKKSPVTTPRQVLHSNARANTQLSARHPAPSTQNIFRDNSAPNSTAAISNTLDSLLQRASTTPSLSALHRNSLLPGLEQLRQEIKEAENQDQLDLEEFNKLIVKPFFLQPDNHARKLQQLSKELKNQEIPCDSLSEITLSKGTKIVWPSWYAGLILKDDGQVLYDPSILNNNTNLKTLFNTATKGEYNKLFVAEMACDTRCIMQKQSDGTTRYFVPGIQYISIDEDITDKVSPSHSSDKSTITPSFRT